MSAVCLLFSENPRFVEALKDLESSPICQALKMQSFLMLPMQRITRLPLLIGAIFSRLDENSAEYEPCQEALNIIDRVRLNSQFLSELPDCVRKSSRKVPKNDKIRNLADK